MKTNSLYVFLVLILLSTGCSEEELILPDDPKAEVESSHLKAAPGSSTIAINTAVQYQVIRGFGGSSAWHDYLSDSDCDKLFSTLGLSILRVRISPDGIWDDELSNAQKAKERGAIVFASPWSPPAYMKSNNSTIQGYLLPEYYTDYANWLNSFVNAFSQIPIYAVSVQNEPNISVSYESCDWSSDQMFDFMVNNAGSINCRVLMPETFNYLPSYADPILNDPAGEANTDICAYHWYGANRNQLWTNAYTKGKDIWMTEHYSDDQSLTAALETAIEIKNQLTINYANAYIWWYVKNPSCNLITDAGINPRGYVIGQFAKFIRPGYTRVDVNGNSNVTAFVNGSSVVIVDINYSSKAATHNFTISDPSVTSVTPYITNATYNLKALAPISVTNGSFTASIPTYSITTFVTN